MFLVSTLAKKVPKLTIYFWIIKILTTGKADVTTAASGKRMRPSPSET